MTAKRFTLKEYTIGDYAILDDGTEIAYASYKSAFTFCELLNELHEENTMLKERRHEDINDLSVIAMKFKALEKENKQLKQYKEAIWNCDSSKIIRVNANTGEVDLIDKELEE